MRLGLRWIARHLMLAALVGIVLIGQPDSARAGRPASPEGSGASFTLTEKAMMPGPDGGPTPQQAPAGGQAFFQVTAVNTGTQTVSGVLTETLPSGMTFASATLIYYDPAVDTWVTNPITPMLNGNQAVYTLGSLVPQDFATLNLTLQLDPSLPLGTVLTDTTAIDYVGDPITSGVTASAAVQVVASTIDLGIAIRVAFPTTGIAPGSQVQYVINFGNTGTGPAQGVTLTDTMPAGMTYVSTDSNQAHSECAGADPQATFVAVTGNQVEYSAGNLGEGAGGCVYVTFQLDPGLAPGTTVANTVQISGTGVEVNPANNVATNSATLVSPTVYLSAGLYNNGGCVSACNPYPVGVGSSVDFGVALNNSGNAVDHNVVVAWTIPSGMTFVSALALLQINYLLDLYDHPAYPATPTINGNVATFTLGDVPEYSQLTLLSTFQLDPSVPIGTTLTSTATVTFGESGSNSGNTTSSITDQVAAPLVDVYESQNPPWPGRPLPGSAVNLVVSYGSGAIGWGANADAHGVVLTDTLPSGMTFSGASQVSCQSIGLSCGAPVSVVPTISGNALTFSLGTLPILASGTITITGQLSNSLVPGSNVTNAVQISSQESDINPANNASSMTIIIGGSTPTPTATSTPTTTPTGTITPTSTSTSTATASPTFTPTATSSPSASATRTTTPSATATVTPTWSATPTAKPTPAGISIAAKASPAAVLPGEPVQYGLDVRNVSGGSVKIAQVRDYLPTGFTYVPGSTHIQACSPCATIGTPDPTITSSGGYVVLTWTRSDILANPPTDLLVTFRATAPTTPGVYTDAATASDSLGQTARIVGAAPVTVTTPTPTPTLTPGAILSAEATGG